MALSQSDHPSPSTCVYIRQPVKSCVVRQALPCTIGGATNGTSVSSTRQEVVLVKDNVLELMIFDAMHDPVSLRSVAEQHVFGQIKDVKLLKLPRRANNLQSVHMETDEDVSVDCLACLSDSGYLTFVSFQYDVREDALIPDYSSGRFVRVSEVSIAPPGLDYKDLGHTLAVDPLSRAIAVTAFEGILRVWPVSNAAATIVSNEECATLHEEGILWQIAFLYPPENESDLVQFVVAKNIDGNLTIVVYEYRRNQPLEEMKRWAPHVITQDVVPLHMFALSEIPGSFILITDGDMHFVRAADDRLEVLELPPLRSSSERPERQVVVAASISPARDCLSAEKQSLRQSLHQTLYLATEQKHLFRMQVTAEPMAVTYQYLTETKTSARALAVLHSDAHVEYNALFGDFCDGEIMTVDANMVITTEMPIRNWAPVLDFNLADLHREGHDTIVLTSGAGAHGSVREIRNGIGVTVHASERDTIHGANGLWSLKRRVEDDSDAFLVLSFVHETRIMSLEGAELEDVGTENHGFDTTVSTIKAASLNYPGLYVQIHPEAVKVAELGSGKDIGGKWMAPPGDNIALGAVSDDLVVVCLARTNTIVLLQVTMDEDRKEVRFNEMGQRKLDTTPSCLYCPSSAVQRLCREKSTGPLFMVGTFEPSLLILSLCEATPLAQLHKHTLVATMTSESISIPHSFAVLMSNSGIRLLAGLRDGKIAAFRWTWQEGRPPILTSPDMLRVGFFPVELVSHPQEDHVIAFTDRAWKVFLSGNEIGMTGISFPRVLHATPFAYAGVSDGYMVIAKQTMHFIELDEDKRANMRSLNIGEAPRRILFDAVTRKVLVATTVRHGGEVGSELRVMDPMSGRCYLKESLQTDEKIYALKVWNVKEGKRYICVGTWGYRATTSSEAQGRVLVYNLKAYEKREKPACPQESRKPVMYKMKQLGEMILDGPVQSICPFLGSYLLAAAGDTFYQLKIDAHTRKLVIRAQLPLRWPIQCIDVHGTRVIVGGQKESVSFYSYNVQTKTFEFLKSDRYGRPTAACLAIDDTTAVATDKCGNIVGFSAGDYTGLERTLDTTFSFHLGEAVMRLQLGSIVQQAITEEDPNRTKDEKSTLSHWYSSEGFLRGGWGPPADSVAAIATSSEAGHTGGDRRKHMDGFAGPRVIYGCSLLGSLFAILKITAELYERLIVLQEVMAVHEKTRPLLGNDHARYRSESLQIKFRGSIDGELLSQFPSLDAETKTDIVKQWNDGWTVVRPLAAELRGNVTVEDLARLIKMLDEQCF
ncbi:uncharacterized protein SPPG_08681 [Spizellomyces punctatus DAOM BR117]|uniref:DNA damage-binding protein 1 n=1 Tax=Spizellomyces punctatus (strain DAOM BR117) TaxID=645134 RepID=A0A0L0H3Z8_SPIPD|nr:uncharacterized protein SPPG_08681 [Spizellomyces punctatus DAOM BR117]KNC95927.1 hypothetical protein SPPG_08681 [Spizellomyces punctatus DAOM BR117]|eukprot:XP_016603967.1 hypothetical protein SPPG_08681 [Spizellomyces punctatus DAOM BR117]